MKPDELERLYSVSAQLKKGLSISKQDGLMWAEHGLKKQPDR